MQLVNQLVIHVMHYLNQGIYPNILKFTTVKLIYKKGKNLLYFTIDIFHNFLKDFRKSDV